MNPETGREFDFPNPQDDPHLYPVPPAGFGYDLDGHLIAVPHLPREESVLRNLIFRQTNNEDIIGMNVDDARQVLHTRGWTMRVTVEDGKSYMVTMDMRNDRLNVEVMRGKVERIDGVY